MAPETEQDLLRRGLNEKWSKDKVIDELAAMRKAGAARVTHQK
jgi:hypothetical protein